MKAQEEDRIVCFLVFRNVIFGQLCMCMMYYCLKSDFGTVSVVDGELTSCSYPGRLNKLQLSCCGRANDDDTVPSKL